MQIGDEVIWSTLSAITVGLTLKSTEFFIVRKNANSESRDKRIEDYHVSIEEELNSLREENRKLRAEADLYRQKYFELLSTISKINGKSET